MSEEQQVHIHNTMYIGIFMLLHLHVHVHIHYVNVLFITLGRIAKNNNHLLYMFVYTVKNTQPNVVKVKVMEQVPLSSDERLKVGQYYMYF